jgi:hypothetical protein
MYPPERAFLIQFSSDADPARGRLIGRAEHIQSGKKFRFNSPEELDQFMKQVLIASTGATSSITQDNHNSK